MSTIPDSALQRIQAAAAACVSKVTPGIEDMSTYLGKQSADTSHRTVRGPLLPATGASGVVVHAGQTLAHWGDPHVPEMLFSATKSLISTVAGIAFDRGLLSDVDVRVVDAIDLPELETPRGRLITWRHLLQQTSNWDGVLWEIPAAADAQSRRPGSAAPEAPAGTGWAYNDVRVNLLCLALTLLFKQELPEVLRESILQPLAASKSWSWHGYDNSVASVGTGAGPLKVVSGGAHWGGGMWMSASDLARIGQLYLQRGQIAGRQYLSPTWIDQSFAPCPVQPDYGYLWWRNDFGRIFPPAPRTGRCARGNGGRHLLWIDPARELVIAAHWTENIGAFIGEVSDVIACS